MPPKQTFIQKLLGESTIDNTQTEANKQALVDKIRSSIGTNETSIVKNSYSSTQYSGNPALGNALGKYRVTEGQLKAYGQRYLGQPVTPKAFLGSPSMQDMYMDHMINSHLSQGYTPQQVADIHNQGLTHEAAPGSATYQSPSYVNSFNKTFN